LLPSDASNYVNIMHSLNVEISLLCCLFIADTQVFSYLPLLQIIFFSLGYANKRKTNSDKKNQKLLCFGQLFTQITLTLNMYTN
jgi:hypothetical protein